MCVDAGARAWMSCCVNACGRSYLAPNVQPKDVIGWKLGSQSQWEPTGPCTSSRAQAVKF